MKLNKKKRKNNFFYDNIKKSISYIKEIKVYILFVIILFVLSSIVGFLYHPDFFVETITSMIEELIKKTENLNSVELTSFIIINNTKTSFSGFIFGIFFAFVPIFITLLNGYLLGFVANISISEGGIFVLWRLLPHGIFEIPAVLISLGLGVKLGSFIFFLKDREKGFLAFFITFITSFFIFFAFYIIFFIGFLFINFDPSITTNPDLFEIKTENFVDNPLISLSLLILFFISFFISLLLGMRVFGKKERSKIFENLKYNFISSFRVFLFIVIPLLLIAGLIEGVLIYFLDRFSENLVEIFLTFI